MRGQILASADKALLALEPRALFWGIVTINFVLVALITASTFIPRRARISVEAETEIASIELPAGHQSLAWGKLALGPKSVDTLPKGCTAPILSLAADLATPLVDRLTVDLRLAPVTELLSITLNSDHGDVGTVTCEDGRQFGSGRYVNLLLPKSPSRSLVLPFDGYLTVGGNITEGSSSLAILRNGAITVEASSFPFRNGAVRTETKLYAGDIVQIFDSKDTSRRAVSHGLLLIGEDGPIEVVAHGEAREAHIIHVGQEMAAAASVAPTFWAKVQAQSEWTLLILLGALILNIVGALHRYRVEVATGKLDEGS